VWLKLSDDFADDAARAGLSDASFRTHIEALLWIMRREGEPVLDRRDLLRALESPQVDEAVPELLATGWWQRQDDGRVRVLHGMDHQPEPEVIARRREAATERQRRKRLKAVGIDPDTGEDVSRRDTTRDSWNDATRDPGRAGTGRGGPGEALSLDPPTDRGAPGDVRRDCCGGAWACGSRRSARLLHGWSSVVAAVSRPSGRGGWRGERGLVELPPVVLPGPVAG
jgi:hypothetical protein